MDELRVRTHGRHPDVFRYARLLGNFNGNMSEDDLATRQRVVLKQPLSFDDLYHPYADSWRISPRESLLSQLCGDANVQPGIPSRPFNAENLDPKVYERTRARLRAGRSQG